MTFILLSVIEIPFSLLTYLEYIHPQTSLRAERVASVVRVITSKLVRHKSAAVATNDRKVVKLHSTLPRMPKNS